LGDDFWVVWGEGIGFDEGGAGEWGGLIGGGGAEGFADEEGEIWGFGEAGLEGVVDGEGIGVASEGGVGGGEEEGSAEEIGAGLGEGEESGDGGGGLIFLEEEFGLEEECLRVIGVEFEDGLRGGGGGIEVLILDLGVSELEVDVDGGGESGLEGEGFFEGVGWSGG
jgi:hypothetical protein